MTYKVGDFVFCELSDGQYKAQIIGRPKGRTFIYDWSVRIDRGSHDLVASMPESRLVPFDLVIEEWPDTPWE